MNRLSYFYIEEEDGSLVPKARIHLAHKGRLTEEFDALIDSGSDITFVPRSLAAYLDLTLGEEIAIQGMGGTMMGNFAMVNVLFLSDESSELIRGIPVVISDWSEIIIGRKAVFDAFRITFTQARRLVEMERTAASAASITI